VIFVVVYVSRVFELGRNVSCEELNVSPSMGLISFMPCHSTVWAKVLCFQAVLPPRLSFRSSEQILLCVMNGLSNFRA